MADFIDHIAKVTHNLKILQEVNKINDSCDWQITICYYTSVHLIDGYLAREGNLHFMSHGLVDSAINPFNQLAVHKLDEELYLCYEKLSNLSRQSRYLCSEQKNKRNDNPEKTYSSSQKHLKKAIINLDKLLRFFSKKYDLNIDKVTLICTEFSSNTNLDFFKINHFQTVKEN